MVCRTGITVIVFCALIFAQVDLTGTVTNQAGAPIEGVSLFLIGQGLSGETDASGQYHLTGALSVLDRELSLAAREIRIDEGVISFSITEQTPVTIDLFDMAGALAASPVSGMLNQGTYSVPLRSGTTADGMYMVRAQIGKETRIFQYVPFTSHRRAPAPSIRSPLAKSAVIRDYLQALKAGYQAKQVAVESFQGTINIVLDTTTGGGSNPFDDGSAARLDQYGEAQYFYGDMGDGSVPMVKITHSVVGDIADVEVNFNPAFVDNQYGSNSDWSHQFKHITGSDHVEVAFVNGDGDTVLACKLDLLSASADAPSGYASLGPFGGDGEMMAGDPKAILSWGTTMDDNLNYYGYGVPSLPESSPKTDSVYTPNPDYPNYQYYVAYHLSLDADIFGSSGYGEVHMTYVHASPSRNGPETVEVTEGSAPTPDSPQDPWRYYDTPTTPPDTSSTPDTTVTDTTDTTEIPG